MKIGHKIERLRQERNIPLYVMCDIMAIPSEAAYSDIVRGNTEPTIYQLVMLVIFFSNPLEYDK